MAAKRTVFKRGDRVVPKSIPFSPIEEGLSAITSKEPLVVMVVGMNARQQTLVFTHLVEGTFRAGDFEKASRAKRKRRTPRLHGRKPLLFDGL